MNHLRGDEALAAKTYFQGLAALISSREGELLRFTGRTRRPPKDPFNALLSFGYALLYRDCVAGLLAAGLEPAFGFMHTPRSAAYPLAMDIMDLFRSLLWDIPLIGSVNRNHWVREDFDITREKVWLSDQGRRKAITTYETRKAETCGRTAAESEHEEAISVHPSDFDRLLAAQARPLRSDIPQEARVGEIARMRRQWPLDCGGAREAQAPPPPPGGAQHG